MADEKPMTVKERMAALAKASGGSAPTPGPPKSASASPGTSVAQRLAKLNRGSGQQGGGASSPPKSGNLVRTFTPPGSAPSTSTRSPGTSQATAGSSVADRIAMLSGASNASTSSTSPTPVRPTSTLTPAFARTASVESTGSTASVQQAPESSESRCDRVAKDDGKPPAAPTGSRPTSGRLQSFNSDDASGAPSSPAKPSSTESPRISAGLAARMQAVNVISPALSVKSNDTERPPSGVSAGPAARLQALNAASAAGRGEALGDGEGPPPPPSSSAGSATPSRMSPGLAARMQALGGLSPGKSEGDDSTDRSGKGAGRPLSSRMGGVALSGIGMAIPLPGVVPPGGLSELKRRKQQAEAAERGELAVNAENGGAGDAMLQQEPGQLQHANLTRATMPQRRRPRKPGRPFKATATGSVAPSTTTSTGTTTKPMEPPVSATTIPTGTGQAKDTIKETASTTADSAELIVDTVVVDPTMITEPERVESAVKSAGGEPMSAAQRLAAAAAAKGGAKPDQGDSGDEWD